MAASDLMPVDEAFNQLLAQARVLTEIQEQPVSDALGCIVAESPISGVNVPPTDNSAVDGFAIRYQDYQQQGTLPVSQRIPAGIGPDPLKPGTAARIFTGAAIPSGADTVIMQENTEVDGDTLSITKAPEAGQNIRPKGQDIEQGEALLDAGTRLLPQHLGLLASVGIDRVRVYRPLTVAILSTGDELVAPGRSLQPGQIYNSNRDMLRGLITAAGWRIHECGDVADTLDATRDALSDAAERADIIVTTGGVSVGEEDHIRDAIQALGQLNLWRLAIKPGKPLAFGHIAAFMDAPAGSGDQAAQHVAVGIVDLARLKGPARCDQLIPGAQDGHSQRPVDAYPSNAHGGEQPQVLGQKPGAGLQH